MNFKCCIAKIRALRHLNLFLAIVAAALLALWAVRVFIFSAQDTGTVAAAEQVEKLAENIRRYYQNRPDFWGLNTQTVLSNQIAPRGMIKDNQIVNYYGSGVTIGNGENGEMLMPGARRFDITFTGLTKRQCREIASFKFSEKFWLGVTGITISHNEKSVDFDWNDAKNSLPVKQDAAAKICGDNSRVSWHFN